MSVAPVMPVSTLRNAALPPAITNTPWTSSLRAFSSAGVGLVAAIALPPVLGFTSRSPFCRMVSAWIGMVSAFWRVAVVILAVQDRPGRISSGGSSMATTTLKSLASWLETALWEAARPVERRMAVLPISGVEFNFSQSLQDNVSEAVSGVKGENSIKLYGNDLQALTDTANKIKAQLATVQGITDLAVFTSLGQPTIQIDIDRAKAARYGLAPGDINATIRVAIGGDTAGDLYEPGSDRHFPIIVRLAPEYRKSAEAIQNLRIGAPGPNGTIAQIPLSELASRSEERRVGEECRACRRPHRRRR